jgi:glycosyltransferase involved in cell wall biosynthesis
VRAGLTGDLVPHGDPAALAGQMLRYANDPSLVARLGRQARAWAEQLTWDAAAAATEAHLERLVTGGRLQDSDARTREAST